MSKPTVGSLFAGIGGFDLGFERAGFETVWQVEIDPWCRKVLAKNFPNAERHEDVRTVGSKTLRPVDVICGGFPCQDISNAGLRAGIEGERSGLWSEFARIIGELRPKYVLVENVAALLGRGMGRVLGDLASIGYDAEWEIVSAADVRAPHLRERVWILAYPNGGRLPGQGVRAEQSRRAEAISTSEVGKGCNVADTPSERCTEPGRIRHHEPSQWSAGGCEDVSDPNLIDAQRQFSSITNAEERQDQGERQAGSRDAISRGFWAVEPNVGRVAHGVPKRVDRLRGLGNAVVPQIPEMYARRIHELLSNYSHA